MVNTIQRQKMEEDSENNVDILTWPKIFLTMLFYVCLFTVSHVLTLY